MLTFDEMPEDNADLARIKVTFPYLADDSEKSSPVPIDDILAYLAKESPDGSLIKREQLKFLRTARVRERQYWIWSFIESDGSSAYVTVCSSPDGVEIGYEINAHRLSPEQFMLGDYHGVF